MAEHFTRPNIEKVVGKLGTTPEQRGLSTQEFKDKFDEMPEAIQQYIKETLLIELDAFKQEFMTHQAESASKHIAESAYNSDGYYIKFDDGTLICTGVREFTDVPCTLALGAIFYAGSNHFPMGKYPHPFDTTNVPIVLNLSSYNDNALTAWVTTSTFNAFDGVNINASINYIRHESTTFSKVWIFFRATGRWKP